MVSVWGSVILSYIYTFLHFIIMFDTMLIVCYENEEDTQNTARYL